MSSTVPIIATSVDTMRLLHATQYKLLRLEENHKFLIIETPRSVLVFNRVISGVECPKQNKKVSPRHRRIQ